MASPLDGLPDLDDFQAFPIYAVETGLYTARQPWLSPHTASKTLENGHSFRGRISKRAGYELLAQLGTYATYTTSGATGQNLWLDVLPNIPVLPPEASPSTYKIVFNDTATTWSARLPELITPGNYEIKRDSDDRVDGTINVTSGIWQIDLPGVETFAGEITVTYEYNRGLTVMGIASFFQKDGTEFLVVCDTKRLFQWSSGEQRFYDRLQADSFTAGDDDHFWFVAFEDHLWMTNRVDPVKKYQPGTFTLSTVGTGWTGAANQLSTCSMIFRDKGRLIYLDTTEVVGGRNGTRVRITPPNDVEYSQAPNNENVANYYADAPVNDTIVSAAWLGKELVVQFARSTLRLVYTGEPERPYAWERIPQASGNPGTPGGGAHGALSRMGAISFGELVLYRGRTGILATDGVGVYPFDTAIPDFTLGWNQDAPQYTYALLWDEGRRCLWQYADQGEDKPASTLVMQFDDSEDVVAGQGKLRNWGLYRLPFHCYGYTRRQTSVVLDDLTSPTLDEFLVPFDEPQATAGFPLILAGGRDGKVYVLGTGSQDDGSNFRFQWSSQELNPYVNPKRGRWQRAHLGPIAFLFSSWPDAEVTVRFYADQNPTPWLTLTVDRSPVASSQDPVLLLRNVNRVATWHRIEIETNDAFPFHVDAVIPYFSPEGSARRVQ